MRIRTVKPEFWISEQMSTVSEGAALLAIGLLNYADDEGYFNANSELIRCALYPLRKPSKPIPQMLGELHSIGYIELGIASGGKTIGKVTKFNVHQVISHPKPSKLKCFFTLLEPSSTLPVIVHDASSTLPSLNGTGNREQGMEQGTGNAPKPALGDFEEFWETYPNKKAKGAAEKVWKQTAKVRPELPEVLAALIRSKLKWKDPNYIPYPASWLRAKCWLDSEPTVSNSPIYLARPAAKTCIDCGSTEDIHPLSELKSFGRLPCHLDQVGRMVCPDCYEKYCPKLDPTA